MKTDAALKQSISLVAFSMALAVLQAQGQTNGKAPEPTLSPIEQTIKDIKNPTTWFNWGADLRIRNEYFNNARTLSDKALFHEQDFFRFRGRLWASYTPDPNFDLNARVVAEPREWINPSFNPYFRGNFSSNPQNIKAGHTGIEWTEGIVDGLNFRWRNIADMPLNLSAGRQDMILADGWLVGDGTPGDGSRTYFFDSARLTYKIEEIKTTVDAIGILQYSANDAWLPPINHLMKPLTDQNEKGAILYVANKMMPKLNIDGYFIYKHDSIETEFNDINATKGDNANIYTVGGRVSGDLSEHWRYRAEGAYQFGHKQDPFLNPRFGDPKADRNISAFGVVSRVSYLFNDPLNNQLHLNYEYLSGDDPGTKGKDEMFDILWGRWPQWSELYIYSYVPETRMSQIANLYRFGPGWSIKPTEKMEFIANYFALFADQDTPTRAGTSALVGSSSLFSRGNSFRGHYFQSILKYKFNSHLAGHLWGEAVVPGDFYTRHNLLSFLRAEIYLTF